MTLLNNKNTYRPSRLARVLLLMELVSLCLVLLYVFWFRLLVPELEFEHPKLVFLLLASSLLSLLFWWAQGKRNKALKTFSSQKLWSILIPQMSPRRHVLRFILWRWGLALIIIAMMNPRVGSREIDIETRGVDLMICLDVSHSMRAQDMEPDRLATAKRSIFKMLDELKGDRVGFIPFAGDAFVQLPLTSDYRAAGLFLNSMGTDIIPTQGTAIGKAIDMAVERLEEYSKGGASIIILTDGENHEDDAIAAAQRAAKLGISIHTVGLGTAEGAPIPLDNIKGRQGFKKDKNGKTVVSRYNADMLREIASAGDGLFLNPVDGYLDLAALHDAILAMEETETGQQKYEVYHERFQIFLLLAALLLVIESLLAVRKPSREPSFRKNLGTLHSSKL